MSAVALRRRVPRRVHEVDAHALRVDDVVGLVQRPDLLVPRDHRVLPEVRAGCLDPGMGDSLFKCLYFCSQSLKASTLTIYLQILTDTGKGKRGSCGYDE